VVISTVVVVPTGRAVCEAFVAAMRRYGVPSEVLTGNGNQFTGRHTRPEPAEVLFERVCRHTGITARRTKPRSPTTTGKIERFHKTLREDFLDHVAPFVSLEAAQQAIDEWVASHNHQRPHQSLDMVPFRVIGCVWGPFSTHDCSPFAPRAAPRPREVATDLCKPDPRPLNPIGSSVS
jgi:transposase InsO family protein